jgi:DNA repair protein RecO (recombination protein O)
MSRTFRCRAVVLAQQRLRETDVILRLISDGERGVFDAVAKGLRKANSKLAGTFQPLNHVEAEFIEGRSLDVATWATLVEQFPCVRKDIGAGAAAQALAETILLIAPRGGEAPELYALILDVLRAMQEGAPSGRVMLRSLYELLGQEGRLPRLDACARCGSREGNRMVFLDPAEGGFRCGECGAPSGGGRGVPMDSLFLLARIPGEKGFEWMDDYGESVSRAALNALVDFTAWILPKKPGSYGLLGKVSF